jgi:hypothetical protein
MMFLGVTGMHGALIGGEGNFWFYFFYIGFLGFIGIQLYMGLATCYIWDLSRKEKPVFYWSTMLIYSGVAAWIAYGLLK